MLSRKIILFSKLPFEEYLEKLRSMIYQQNSFSYQLWINEDSRTYSMWEYYGRITGTTFDLVKVVCGKNFFTPIVRGKVTDKSEYTEVELFIRNSPYVKLAYAVLFAVGCINIIIFLSALEIICVFSIVVDILIFLAFWGLNYHHVNHFIQSIESDFELN